MVSVLEEGLDPLICFYRMGLGCSWAIQVPQPLAE